MTPDSWAAVCWSTPWTTTHCSHSLYCFHAQPCGRVGSPFCSLSGFSPRESGWPAARLASSHIWGTRKGWLAALGPGSKSAPSARVRTIDAVKPPGAELLTTGIVPGVAVISLVTPAFESGTKKYDGIQPPGT